MKKSAPLWNPIKWPYNSDAPYCDWQCYARKVGRGRVILYPSQFRAGEWSYVASFGATSEKSHSGSFPDGFTLEQAQEAIQRQIDGGKYA